LDSAQLQKFLKVAQNAIAFERRNRIAIGCVYKVSGDDTPPIGFLDHTGGNETIDGLIDYLILILLKILRVGSIAHKRGVIFVWRVLGGVMGEISYPIKRCGFLGAIDPAFV